METDWCSQLAEGLIENGCQYLSIALMEGAEDVQNQVSQAAGRLKFPLVAERAVSEKIGYEIALTYSYGKKRSAFLTHGFSLPVAMDPLMSSIYTGVAGGFVIVTVDTTPPLPYSSNCDPVSLAMFAKMPVLELSGLTHLSFLLKQAFTLSEQFETPVMFHIDTKIPRGPALSRGKTGKKRRTDFEKNPARWAATPRFRFLLHKKLNQRLREIAESGIKGQITQIGGKENNLGIICNHANLSLIRPWAERHHISLLSVQMPFPLPIAPLNQFIRSHKKTVIIEDRFPTIQFQIPEGKKALGRLTDNSFRQVSSWQKDPLVQLLDKIRRGKSGRKMSNNPQPPSNKVKPSPLAHFLSELKGMKSAPLLVADKTPLTAKLPVDYFVSRGGAISVTAGYAHAQGDKKAPPILGITDSPAFLHYGMQATTNAIYNTAPVRCLMVVRPEHETLIHTFLDTMTHVQVIPLKPESKDTRQKLLKDPSLPVTIFTIPEDVA